MSKSTNKELIEDLEPYNTDGRYDKIIQNAKANAYHDYKSDEVAPKLVLLAHLQEYPELEGIVDAVIDGVYDEEMDEADKEDMRGDAPEEIWPLLGLQRDE